MKTNTYKIDLVKCQICGYETTNHQSFNKSYSTCTSFKKQRIL